MGVSGSTVDLKSWSAHDLKLAVMSLGEEYEDYAETCCMRGVNGVSLIAMTEDGFDQLNLNIKDDHRERLLVELYMIQNRADDSKSKTRQRSLHIDPYLDPEVNAGAKYLHSPDARWLGGVTMVRGSSIGDTEGEPGSWYVRFADGQGRKFQCGDLVMLKNMPLSSGCRLNPNAVWYTCERSAADYARFTGTGVDYNAGISFDWHAARYLRQPVGTLGKEELVANARLLAWRLDRWSALRTIACAEKALEDNLEEEREAEHRRLHKRAESLREEQQRKEEQQEYEGLHVEQQAEKLGTQFREDWEVEEGENRNPKRGLSATCIVS